MIVKQTLEEFAKVYCHDRSLCTTLWQEVITTESELADKHSFFSYTAKFTNSIFKKYAEYIVDNSVKWE